VNLKRAFGLVSLCGLLPYGALAQPTVPGLQTGASAQASASAQAGSTPTVVNGTTTAAAKPPPGWPPSTVVIKPPPVVLDHKEANAAAQSAKWRDKSDHPMLDSDGVLRWVYGNSQTRVVCSPLNICDIELQPGETINNIRLGDVGFWNVTLAISGGADGRVTHAAITPREAGREASMLVYTDKRTYSIKLVSAAKSYTAKTGFTYPEAQANAEDTVASYRAAVGAGAMKSGGPTMTMTSGSETGDIAHIELLTISGDNPSWRPLAAYTDGRKTYIQFPHEMQFGDSPALLGVNSDGGIFKSPTERRVIYRWWNDRLIADTVMDKLELVLGVGSSQSKVVLTRRAK
jgi:type IV secretion system protein TrbG